jgi:uncharacterized protein YpmB
MQPSKKTIMNLQYISDNKGKKTGVFIPIDDWKILEKHLSEVVELDYQEPTKAEILEGLKSAFNEVKLHREGKIKLKLARELLHEL